MLAKGVELWAINILEIECKDTKNILYMQILRTKKYGFLWTVVLVTKKTETNNFRLRFVLRSMCFNVGTIYF